MNEFGIHDFHQRFDATEANERMTVPLLTNSGVLVTPWGQETIIGQNELLANLLKNRNSKRSRSALFVKYSPDLILVPPRVTGIYFADIKTSLTPVLFQGQINNIRNNIGYAQLDRNQIGLVEREAWDNYSRRYPSEKTCIIMACPYHPRLLLMEKVSNIQPLFRFQQNVNVRAAGSQTPHVNIDMNTMRRMDRFLSEEWEIDVYREEYQQILETIKTWPLSCPQERWRRAFNDCIQELRPTCPWVH